MISAWLSAIFWAGVWTVVALVFFHITLRFTLSEISAFQVKYTSWLSKIAAVLCVFGCWCLSIVTLGITASMIFHCLIGV